MPVMTSGFLPSTATEGLVSHRHRPQLCGCALFPGNYSISNLADAKGAKAELQICQDLNPPAVVAGFVDSIVAEVDAALAG